MYQFELFEELFPWWELKPEAWNMVIGEIEMGRATRKLISRICKWT